MGWKYLFFISKQIAASTADAFEPADVGLVGHRVSAGGGLVSSESFVNAFDAVHSILRGFFEPLFALVVKYHLSNSEEPHGGAGRLRR